MSALAAITLLLVACTGAAEQPTPEPVLVPLPPPQGASMTLVETLNSRRSHRSFTDAPLTMPAVSGLLLAAQGVSGDALHLRTVPSAGALHPLEVFLVAGRVEGLEPGVYHYDVGGRLELVTAGDLREPLAAAALGQGVVSGAPASLIIAADYARTTGKYGARGERYVHMEVGHVAQNVYLCATALGLGTVSVGAFDDEGVRELLGLPWPPLMIMPLGWPAAP